MKQAVIYTRFSPRKNAKECESCETQLAYCEQKAHDLKLTIKSVYSDEDVSGKDEYREKLWLAIKDLGKGDVLVVYKRDRLARDVYLAEEINRQVEKAGARIVAYCGDVEGEGPEVTMIRQVLEAVAEYERKCIAMRTKHAMLLRQRHGQKFGAECPFGWKDDPNAVGHMIKDEHEQRVIAEMLAKYHDCGHYGSVATWLNKDRRPYARHGVWNRNTVKGIIEREMK